MDQDRSTQQWVSAYLEWIDVQAGEAAFQTRQVFIERRGIDRRASAPEPSREDVLLIALRAESDCVHLLRQALDTSRDLAARVH